jgi:hypothetical protein
MPIHELFMYEIGRLLYRKSPPVVCPLMVGHPHELTADKSLLLCDCPNARRVALQEIGMTRCTHELGCPPRVLLGFSPTTDQK